MPKAVFDIDGTLTDTMVVDLDCYKSASGAWRPTALAKLDGAGISLDGVPIVTSSEHLARRDILLHAVRSLAGETSAPVVYFGDGVWDGRSSDRFEYRQNDPRPQPAGRIK